MFARFRSWGVGLALAGILLVGAGLRFFGQDWDQGTLLHPDERFITIVAVDRLALPPPGGWGALLTPATSPLNPRRLQGDDHYPYHYGTLPLYLATAGAWFDAALAPGGGRPLYQDVARAGRTLAALADLGTILLVFGIAWRLYGAGAGLVAAALSALAVLQIQIAHFLISEPFLVLLLTAMLYACLRTAQTGSRAAALAAGICLGLAVACKASVAPLALVIGLAMLLWNRGGAGGRGPGVGGVGVRDERIGVDDYERFRPPSASPHPPPSAPPAPGPRPPAPDFRLPHFALVGGVALLGWFVGDPYALLDLPTYVAQVVEEAAVQSGRLDVPYTRQYVGTWPGLYQAQQLALWGIGPAAALAGLAGLGLVAYRAWRGGRDELILLAGFGVYAFTILPLDAKWLRYTLPLVPLLCIFTAGLLTPWAVGSGQWAGNAIQNTQYAIRNTHHVSRFTFHVSRLLVALALLGSILWAAAFMRIYTQEHPRVAASRWLIEHVPAGQGVSAEAWDDRLPVGVPGRARPAYREVTFDLYQDRPGEEVFAHLRDTLAATDMLVLSSNRLYGSIPRLPWRYPVQIRYYELLFAGQLGFTLVHTATSYPGLGPWTIPDDAADESFTVYDHPKVLIFQKTRAVPEAELRALFADVLDQPAVASRRQP